MSSVFEHFYSPLTILEKIQKAKNIEYIYINHPNMDYALTNDVHINLTAEHTFYINNSFLPKILNNYNFELVKEEYFENHTVCYMFKRNNNLIATDSISNNLDSFYNYSKRLKETVEKLNNIMKNDETKKFYMWPASMHLIPLFINGFNYSKITSLLDNSPNKIGKVFYGYDLICESFTEIMNNEDENKVIFLGGASNYKKELDLTNYRGQIIHI
jgi:hypothetical protein